MNTGARITVGITTYNRLRSLVRCVASIERIAYLVSQIIVVDNGSDEPVEEELRSRVKSTIPLTVIRQTGYIGPIQARNRIAAFADTEFLLSLDDDTEICQEFAVAIALTTLDNDPEIAAVAFAQADADGNPWPPTMQPAPVDYPCKVNAYIGFAVLHRRKVFVEQGGYCDLFHFYGEEKEYCLRLADVGYSVVFLPQARITHLADPHGRNPVKYIRNYTRNDCIGALRNYPWCLSAPYVLYRILSYWRTSRRHIKVNDIAGVSWLIGQIVMNSKYILHERRCVSWRTIIRWHRLKKLYPKYLPYTITDI